MGSEAGASAVSTVSGGTYNDGNWHSVRVKHKISNGQFTLFVDGLWQGLGQVAAGETQDSATKIDFGRIQTGYNYFSGQLRNIRFFPDVVANGE